MDWSSIENRTTSAEAMPLLKRRTNSSSGGWVQPQIHKRFTLIRKKPGPLTKMNFFTARITLSQAKYLIIEACYHKANFIIPPWLEFHVFCLLKRFIGYETILVNMRVNISYLILWDSIFYPVTRCLYSTVSVQGLQFLHFWPMFMLWWLATKTVLNRPTVV